MNDTPAIGERVQKYVFNFEIYRFAKKAAKLPHPPLPLAHKHNRPYRLPLVVTTSVVYIIGTKQVKVISWA